ncbi:MAG: iron-sulfur cluster insertion protein ErpA [Gaiellaceae bacterium]
MATVEQSLIVTLTEAAASKVRQLLAQESEDELSVLRVAIQGGGCSGFEYALGFDRGPMEGDISFTSQGVDVVVDPFSAPYLTGTTIDFVESIQEAGFKIENPNAVSSCGCGHSFQVADEEGAPAAGDGCGGGCSH